MTLRAPLGNVTISPVQAAAGGPIVTAVSAASYNGELSAESIVAAFGENLAPGTLTATSVPLPTTLGGVTVTETAWRHPERVAALVYIGAIVPAPGESAAMAIGVDMPPGPRMPTEERARMFFGNDMPDGQWAEHWKTLVPESAILWNSQLTGYPRGVPITYVSMTDDVGVPPALAKQMIANLGPDVDHRVLSAGHIVMVTKPRELAEIINDVVGRV